MNNHSLVGASCSGPGSATEIQVEVTLRERLEKVWATLGESLSNIRSINYKLFMPEPCSNVIEKGEAKNTEHGSENIENLICLIESAAVKIEIETREINGGL